MLSHYAKAKDNSSFSFEETSCQSDKVSILSNNFYMLNVTAYINLKHTDFNTGKQPCQLMCLLMSIPQLANAGF
jgi:hypothetical protein